MPLIIPSNSISGEYEVANSLRFNKSSSDSLTRTPSSAGNRKTFTFSTWFKKGDFGGTEEALLYSEPDAATHTAIRIDGSDKLRILCVRSGSTANGFDKKTTRVFRDPSAWYHVVVAFDTTQSTADDRIKIYINGVQETAFDTNTFGGSQSLDTDINSTTQQEIGMEDSVSYFGGYLAETVVVDGTQLDATSFGEFDEDTGIWKPIDVSGLTFGTNGFYLDFENSGSLGADVSGNGNNFTVNNLTSIDQTTDTPTNNFATMNPLDNYYSAFTFSEGNLKVVTDASSFAANTSTIGVNSGKWYVEIKATNIYNGYAQFGIKGRVAVGTEGNDVGNHTDGYAYTASLGQKVNNGSASSYGTVWNNGDIIGIAVDLDNNYLYFSRNGTWQNSGDPESGSSGTGAAFSLGTPSSGFYYFATSDNDADPGTENTYEFNFGNPPYSISSGNSDANGYGNFEYSVPSGYYALNSKNLAEYG